MIFYDLGRATFHSLRLHFVFTSTLLSGVGRIRALCGPRPGVGCCAVQTRSILNAYSSFCIFTCPQQARLKARLSSLIPPRISWSQNCRQHQYDQVQAVWCYLPEVCWIRSPSTKRLLVFHDQNSCHVITFRPIQIKSRTNIQGDNAWIITVSSQHADTMFRRSYQGSRVLSSSTHRLIDKGLLLFFCGPRFDFEEHCDMHQPSGDGFVGVYGKFLYRRA